MSPLNDLQLRVLEVAKQAELLPNDGRRQTFVVTQIGMGYTAYLQHLNALLDNQAAVAHAPGLVYRLRRIRDRRNTQRGHVA